MGPRIDSVGFKSGHVGAQTVDDQMKDILNNPRLSENQKREQLEKVFADLPADDKADLYDRLKNRNSKDSVNRDFHYRLSHRSYKPGSPGTVDRLLKTLNPDHGKPAAAAQTTSQASASKNDTATKGPSNAPVDDKTLQAIRDYKQKEPQTNFGPEIRVMAQDTNKPAMTKVSEVQQRLEIASKEDLKKMISESQNWSPAARDLVTEAMKQSPVVMKRIATEFSPQEQRDAIARSYDDTNVIDYPYLKNAMKGMHREALRTWMTNTSESTLNQVIQDTRGHATLNGRPDAFADISEQIKSGDFDIYKKLNPNNQTEIIKTMMQDPELKKNSLPIQYAFMAARDKNAIVDAFQKTSPDLLPNLLHNMPGITNGLLEGLNKENAEFIRDTFLNMADRESNKSLADQYRQRAHYMRGWIEETFKQPQ